VLDDIPGVGPARRKALMKAFSSLEEIKNATVEELINKAGLPRNSAEDIYKFFHD
jgi:excinuclease ABC subunit C